MVLAGHSALLTLLWGMRLLVSNASLDPTRFKVVNVDSTSPMHDFYVAAAKKLLREDSYAPTTSERTFLLRTNGSVTAEIDELNELKEEDSVAVSFDGANFNGTADDAQQPADAGVPNRPASSMAGFSTGTSASGVPSASRPSSAPTSGSSFLPISRTGSPALASSSPGASASGRNPFSIAAGASGLTGSPSASGAGPPQPVKELIFTPDTAAGVYATFWNKHHISLMGFMRTVQTKARNDEVNRRWRILKFLTSTANDFSKKGGLESKAAAEGVVAARGSVRCHLQPFFEAGRPSSSRLALVRVPARAEHAKPAATLAIFKRPEQKNMSTALSGCLLSW